MEFKEGVGVVLPESNSPWILDGGDQPKVIQRIFVTPDGYFPRMKDLTVIFGRCKRETYFRRIKHKGSKYVDWYVIENPTVEDVEKAFMEVNRYYIQHFKESDVCPICNSIDELLFKENCWLVRTTHECSEPSKTPAKVMIEQTNVTYSYGGTEYTVTLSQLLDGVRLHKEIR